VALFVYGIQKVRNAHIASWLLPRCLGLVLCLYCILQLCVNSRIRAQGGNHRERAGQRPLKGSASPTT
jgi:hypothetical protein